MGRSLIVIAFSIFTAYMFIAFLRAATAANAVFFLLTLTFFILGIGELAGSDSILHAGSYIELIIALVPQRLRHRGQYQLRQVAPTS